MPIVSVIKDCQHVRRNYDYQRFLTVKDDLDVNATCQHAECDATENWLCLACNAVLCSRYANGHMQEHYQETRVDGGVRHSVLVSFSDVSVWCQECQSYLEDITLQPLLMYLESLKEPNNDAENESENTPDAEERKDNLEQEEEEEESKAQPDTEDVEEQTNANKDDGEDEQEGEDEEAGISVSSLQDLLANLSMGGSDQETPDTALGGDATIESVCRAIQEGKCRNIIVMSGAGISTSCGIPDFRTAGTGLYDNLQKYDLPSPEAVFHIDYFRRNPKPFYALAKELFPGSFQPSPTHHFIRLLANKGLLLRHYTQNIDTLDRIAGVPPELTVEAHGSFASASCIRCKKAFSQEFVKEHVFRDEVPVCDSCGTDDAYVKPDITFFGEGLPARFHQLLKADFRKCDLLLVLGTSLVVQPFAGLVSEVTDACPRVLVNREMVGHSASPSSGAVLQTLMTLQSLSEEQAKLYGPMIMARLKQELQSDGFRFEADNNYRDVFVQSDCDEGVRLVCKELGWEAELEALVSG